MMYESYAFITETKVAPQFSSCSTNQEIEGLNCQRCTRSVVLEITACRLPCVVASTVPVSSTHTTDLLQDFWTIWGLQSSLLHLR